MNLKSLIKNINSTWIIWLTVIAVTWLNFNQERWLAKNVLKHDVGQYYSYLPAVFYDHDLKLSLVGDSTHFTARGYQYAPRFTSEGKPVIKMSMGMAISYLPFFTLAHIYNSFSDGTRDAYSEPYQFAVLFSSLIYYVIGLFFLGKILRRYFDETIVALTLFAITFGTNVFYYLTLGAGMSHTVNFAFVAIFIYYTIKWHEEKKLIYAILLGVTCGYLTLVRPINILVAVIFILYQVKTFSDLKTKFLLFTKHAPQLILPAVCGFLIFLPQMLYWKYSTGHYLYNSYVGEHFYFNNPHIFKALFGFRKGWLIYTPLMLFAITGLYFIYKFRKEFFWPIIIFFSIYIYVAFSWWCWWYGGSFGQRVLIDIYPLLSIALASQFHALKQIRPSLRKAFYCVLSFFIFLNLFQTMQSKYNILHYDSMTRENYMRIFFTATSKPDREKYLKHPDYKRAVQGLEE